MKIVFRVDSSFVIGTGHVMRCLVLAMKLKEKGAHIQFICQNYKGSLINKIRSHGFNVFELKSKIKQKQDAEACASILQKDKVDWIIVDSYDLDHIWHKYIRPYCKSIMVIDDLANREYDCDILLDQNYCYNFKDRYDDLLPKKCIKFLGPKSLILRDEFVKIQKINKEGRKNIERVILFFGGSDNSHETIKVVKILPSVDNLNLNFDIILGVNNPDIEIITNLCKNIDRVNIHIQINNMAEIMSKADLAIIAGGSTIWEACCLGVPVCTVVTAENQKYIVSYLDSMDLVKNIGTSEKLTSENMLEIIRYAYFNPDVFFKMRDNASEVISNCGESIRKILALITK